MENIVKTVRDTTKVELNVKQGLICINLYADSNPLIEEIDNDIFIQYNTGIYLPNTKGNNIESKFSLDSRIVRLYSLESITDTDLILSYQIPDKVSLTSKFGFQIKFKFTSLGIESYRDSNDYIVYNKGDKIGQLIIQ